MLFNNAGGIYTGWFIRRGKSVGWVNFELYTHNYVNMSQSRSQKKVQLNHKICLLTQGITHLFLFIYSNSCFCFTKTSLGYYWRFQTVCNNRGSYRKHWLNPGLHHVPYTPQVAQQLQRITASSPPTQRSIQSESTSFIVTFPLTRLETLISETVPLGLVH